MYTRQHTLAKAEHSAESRPHALCATDSHSTWMGMLLPGKGMTTYSPKATRKKPTMYILRSSALHRRKQTFSWLYTMYSSCDANMCAHKQR